MSDRGGIQWRHRRRMMFTVGPFWVIFVTLQLVSIVHCNQERCLPKEVFAEVFPKKYPYYRQEPINITIDVSSRITHQLVSSIFQILIQEHLGYERIYLQEYEDHFHVDDTLQRLNLRDDSKFMNPVPTAMLNFEVWVPPEFDIAQMEVATYVKEIGLSAPPGRFGWFIPSELTGPIRKYYEPWNNMIQEISWSFLSEPHNVKDFALSLADYKQYIIDDEGEYYCSDETICTDGLYVPQQCSNGKECAVLLAPHYEETKFVINTINKLQLLVKVAWLGPKLKTAITNLIKLYQDERKDKSFIILYWTPSDIVIEQKFNGYENGTFVNIAFKNCELMYVLGGKDNDQKCKYEMNRLVKFSWIKLPKISKSIDFAARTMHLDAEDQKFMLDMYNKNPKTPIRDIACQWAINNRNKWSSWFYRGEKSAFYIGAILPISSSPYKGQGLLVASKMATVAIANSNDVLPGYDLELIVENGKCRADEVMKSFIQFVTGDTYQNMVGVLGPACSDTVEPIAGVSKHYKMMVISYSAEGASFSDREKYPYFFRTIGENINYKHVYLEFFKKMGWKRLAALTEDGQKYTEYISHMQKFLEASDISFVANNKFPRDRANLEMTWYLEDLKRKSAKIIVADIADRDVRLVMCEAYRLNMTPTNGYIWFLPTWLNTSWYNTDWFNKEHNEKVKCTTAQMVKAITGYFSMTHSFFAPDNATMQAGITVGEWRRNYEKRVYGTHNVPSDYAGFAYDAVWTYAYALDKMIRMDKEVVSHLHTENTANLLLKIIQQTDFNGVSGRIKFYNGSPSRFANINLMEWYDNRSNLVGQFFPNISEDKPEILGGRLELQWSKIKWFTMDGKKPDDGTPPPPTCALEKLATALNVSCEMAIVILNIFIAIILTIAVVAAVMYFKNRYDKKVRITQKYMKSLGIDLLNPHLLGNLDKWEVERNRIIINRKIGEGAFGTVYGGEADLPDVGWVSVAVKTLKVGSSAEEKLDFLSEAEVMKRFDHKNIVRLLAVCTTEEPVYAVMEFMLYGDLKNYLLSRRIFVKSKDSEESEEVNSKKLTNMALDVARGLSYLADLKYVHRDIASRNCLVDRNRVVKIGDFGMTRPMFENDYYRFHRKGMLPVRWMSPESLMLGVFTPASDIWSYGVLLYEIVTFGSFPFMGLSNSEVVTVVKSGATVEPPPGVKPQLEGLLKACWQQDPKKRPSGKEIVSFLAENPRLLQPCVDVPTTLVQLEDSGQLEMHLPDQFRKRSSSSFKQSPISGTGTLPNGLTCNGSSSLGRVRRQHSVEDSGVGIPMENCCPKEPLLGHAKSASSLLNLGKLVGSIQHHRNDSGCEEDHGGPTGPNAISEV